MAAFSKYTRIWQWGTGGISSLEIIVRIHTRDLKKLLQLSGLGGVFLKPFHKPNDPPQGVTTVWVQEGQDGTISPDVLHAREKGYLGFGGLAFFEPRGLVGVRYANDQVPAMRTR